MPKLVPKLRNRSWTGKMEELPLAQAISEPLRILHKEVGMQ